MKKLQKFIKNKDKFGHLVHLNFSRKSGTHKTCIGGTMTIIMLFCLLEIITQKFITLFTKNDTQITSYSENFDVQNGTGIHLNET